MAHTKGPWTVEPRTPDENGRTGPRVLSATGHPIVRLDEYSYPEEEMEANARLIAAAPDLLEAAQLIREVAVVARAGHLNLETVWGRKLHEAIRAAELKAVEAIAKAEGRGA